jgi:diguanylate cyclase (GGDEF)-like protein
MHEPPILPDETQRLNALRSYGILDTAPAVDFDSLVGFIASVCNTPIAAISLIDADRQWFKASVGLTIEQTGRDVAFCAHAIAEPDQALIVHDATLDERFMRNPLVTGDPHICFYAGMPIVTGAGHAIGTICVFDRKPRRLTPLQLEALSVAAQLIMTLIEHTSSDNRLRRTQEAKHEAEQQRHAMARYLTTVEDDRLRIATELHAETSRRARLIDELDHAKSYDTLTTLPNRSSFLRSLTAAHAARIAEPARRPKFALFVIDIDHCKQINDSLGSQAGDELLVQCAERILDVAGPNDVVARLDSDLFAVIAYDVPTGRAASAIGRKLCAAFGRPWQLGETECFVTASVGIAVAGESYANAEQILRDANIALYHSKQQGRDRFAVFTHSLGTVFQTKVDLQRTLALALSNGDFQLAYQPIVSLAGDVRQLEGFEALLRWERPDGVKISPAAFIPAAEESGLIVPLGLWALKTACLQLHQWRRDAILPDTPVQMSVNVSAIQLASARFAATIRDIIRETAIDPSTLVIEVTESAAMQDPQRSLGVLRELRDLGIGIHVDDFGTGYSSLSYLRQLPVTRVKIDRSFVSADRRDELVDPMIVRAIISLAHQLNLKVIAEGVETLTQLEALRELGCDSIQGFYVARPAAEREATAFIAALGIPRTPTLIERGH